MLVIGTAISVCVHIRTNEEFLGKGRNRSRSFSGIKFDGLESTSATSVFSKSPWTKDRALVPACCMFNWWRGLGSTYVRQHACIRLLQLGSASMRSQLLNARIKAILAVPPQKNQHRGVGHEYLSTDIRREDLHRSVYV